jgi:hypothetical protein
VALRLVRRGLRPVARVAVHPCGDGPGGETWRAPLAALGEALRALPRHARCRVIVSNSFARYALAPFSAALVGHRSNQALAAEVFRRIHGEQAKAWTFRVAPAPPGKNRPACALDSGLVEAVELAARNCGVALEAIEPALVAAFNSARRSLPISCWFAVVETGRLVLGLLADGEWAHFAAERCTGSWETALARLLARESLAVAADSLKGEPPCWIARFNDAGSPDPERPEVRLFRAPQADSSEAKAGASKAAA